MKSWYTIKAQANNPKAADIEIFDEIGFWGVTAASFIRDLKSKGDISEINVSINSPGGSVFDGLAIYNALRAHAATVNVRVMGVAASAASFIAMAGDKIVMPENAFMMVHNPMGGVFGNAQEMRDWADTLDKIAASLIGIYVARTGKSEDEVKALLDAETWMTATEAKALGFADEVEPEVKVAAAFDMENLPENIKAAFKQGGKPVEPPAATATLADQIRDLAASSDMAEFASVFALSETSLDAARIAIDNAREVKSLCAMVNSKRAPEFIKSRTPVADVRAKLLEDRADNDVIDTHEPTDPNTGNTTSQPVAGLKTADVWAARRKSH